MTLAVFALLALAGAALALRPLMQHIPWPAEALDERDDVARAVSSLRDLEFARAAGTIAPEDHARLRAALEREAFAKAPSPARAQGAVPVRTIVVASLLAGIVSVLVAVSLPRELGDRAPGAVLTGSLPPGAPSIATLEARVKATPNDVPTRLALADSYIEASRAADATSQYRAVLGLDRDNIAALDGLALVLELAGERDAAQIAVDRVLQIRPRDADALFLRGLIAYKKEDWKTAVTVWAVFLDVGEYHPGAEMVRPLYEVAKRNLANKS